MADKICSLHIVNKKPKTRILGKSIVGPYNEGLYHFFSTDQVMYAQKLEEDKEIEIKSDIPKHILEEIESKKEESNNSPLNQVRANFAKHSAIAKVEEGWNSPNAAYKGEDLSDREGGFASVSSDATKADSEKEKVSPDGEEVETTPKTEPDSAWNSPDDAYQGEDLKDRIEDSVEELEENIGESAKETEENMAVGPQDQTGDQPVEQKPIENTDEEQEASEEEEKPSWYLEYDAVEDMTKQELLDWSEQQVPDEEGLKLKSSDSAASTKENVHNFLSSKFPDHTA